MEHRPHRGQALHRRAPRHHRRARLCQSQQGGILPRSARNVEGKRTHTLTSPSVHRRPNHCLHRPSTSKISRRCIPILATSLLPTIGTSANSPFAQSPLQIVRPAPHPSAATTFRSNASSFSASAHRLSSSHSTLQAPSTRRLSPALKISKPFESCLSITAVMSNSRHCKYSLIPAQPTHSH